MTISKGKTGPKSLTKNAPGGNAGAQGGASSKNDSAEEKTSRQLETKTSSLNGSANRNGGSQAGAVNLKRNQSGSAGVTQRVGKWHKLEEDMPLRRSMIQKIITLLKERKPNADDAWKKKLEDMARRLEDSLYRRASSLAQYSNVETLKKRLQEVAVNMSKRKQMQPRKIPLEKIDAQAIQHYAQKFDSAKREKFLSLPLMQQKEYIVKVIYRKHQLQLQRAQEQVRGANGKVDPVKLKQYQERRRAEIAKKRSSKKQFQ